MLLFQMKMWLEEEQTGEQDYYAVCVKSLDFDWFEIYSMDMTYFLEQLHHAIAYKYLVLTNGPLVKQA